MTDELNHPPCGCERYKHSPRDGAAVAALQHRLSRMIGQLGGIKKMIEDNRYCGDILLQVAAAERALQSFGYELLQDHIQTCVTEDIKEGCTDAAAELIELVKKLK